LRYYPQWLLDIESHKKAVCFIGQFINKQFNPLATAFFVSIDGATHIVTAEHVIYDEDGNLIDGQLTIAFNKKDGTIGM